MKIKKCIITVKIGLFLTLTLVSCAPRISVPSSIVFPPTEKTSEPFSHPLEKARILSPFGRRGRTFHMGIDLQNNRSGGDAVMASRKGRVIYAKRMNGYGNIVSIYHSDGYTTRYAHLKKFNVKSGERVSGRQIIGIVGKTGRASTPHLHFEVITPRGKFTDPMYFLKH